MIAYRSWAALRDGLSGLWLLPVLALGILTWTLAEYVLHRFVFHIQPTNVVTKFV